jgi:hypothetical protein
MLNSVLVIYLTVVCAQNNMAYLEIEFVKHYKINNNYIKTMICIAPRMDTVVKYEF